MQTTELQRQEGLVHQASMLNKAIENSFIELALVLVEIEEAQAYKFAYETFSEYYQKELGRNKSTISQLLTVGKWIREHNLLKETKETSYRKLYTSLQVNEGKEPSFILSAAQTLTLKELEQDGREKKYGVCTDHEAVTWCAKCHERL